MKIPISRRLLSCAALVPPGARVADVGCDHGYLSIYLLRHALAAYVVAADLREKPLRSAEENAARFGVDAQIRFTEGNGLAPILAEEIDTIVCAGMGGDTIAAILAACPWIFDAHYTLVLQPQTSGNDLRRWLGEHGFVILQENLTSDGGFLYAAMQVRFGGGAPLSPGHQYASTALLQCESPLLGAYLQRVARGVQKAVAGISNATREEDRSRLAYYETALREIQEMRVFYDDGSEHS